MPFAETRCQRTGCRVLKRSDQWYVFQRRIPECQPRFIFTSDTACQ